MKLWARIVATLLAAAFTVAACSDDDVARPKDALGVDDGASAGIKESVKIDGTRDARLTLDTGATLTLPKDAVGHSVEIAIERPADAKALDLVKSLPSAKAISSAPYVLTPHGTTFNKEVTLELPVAKHQGRELVVAWLKDENDREWKVLSDAKVRDDVAVVTLKHFSVVVLLERESAGLTMDVPASVRDAGERDGAAQDGTGSDAGGNEPVDELPDAGSTFTSDAGVGVDVDAGAAPRADVDAGEPPPARSDAGNAQASDAGTGSEFDSSDAVFDAAWPEPPDADTWSDATWPEPPDADTWSDAASPEPPDADTWSDAASPEPPDAGDTWADADPYSDSATCEPFVCQPFECGLVPDGCGNYLDCGPCGDAGGTCEPLACQPNECGVVWDGCDSYLDCGDCSQSGGVCGLYVPNECGLLL